MGFWDALFGRSRLKKPRMDGIMALSTAQVTLATSLGVELAPESAVVLKGVEAGSFHRVQQELSELVRYAARETETEVETQRDAFGYLWFILRDPDVEDRLNLVHLVAEELTGQGYGERLLAAVFPLMDGEARRYLIYPYKRGRFYPFAPSGSEKKRDHAWELRVASLLKAELPWEQDTSRWYPLWERPI